MKQIPF
jgi:hypothetical protein